MDRMLINEVCELFKTTTSVDCIREKYPNIDAEEICDILVEHNLVKNRPKKQYMAGVLTYIVSEEDIVDRIQQLLREDVSKCQICKQLHIGHTRLNKLIEKYGWLPNTDFVKDVVRQFEAIQSQEKQEPVIESTNNVESIENPTELKNVKSQKVSDEEVLAYAQKRLAEGSTRKQICKDLHIGHTRLERLLREQKAQESTEIEVESSTDSIIKDEPVQDVQAVQDVQPVQVKELSDQDLAQKIQVGLSQGKSKRLICSELHIGIKRLNKLIAKYIEKKESVEINSTTTTSNCGTLSKFNGITGRLIAIVQTYMMQGYSDDYIAKQVGISVNKVTIIKRLLKLTNLTKFLVQLKELPEDHEPTIIEKVVYANSVYGVGRWKFLTNDEIKQLLLTNTGMSGYAYMD